MPRAWWQGEPAWAVQVWVNEEWLYVVVRGRSGWEKRLFERYEPGTPIGDPVINSTREYDAKRHASENYVKACAVAKFCEEHGITARVTNVETGDFLMAAVL